MNIEARDLQAAHLGATVTTTAVTDDGVAPAAGVLRYFTVLADEIVVALQDGDRVVQYWLPYDTAVTVTEGQS